MSPTSSTPYDLAIIGSGSAAFAAAIRARDHGKRVVLIERSTLGGTCVNVGCIPSKALIAAAEQRWHSSRAAFPGITTTAGPVDMPALMAGVKEIVGGLRREKYQVLADEHGIDVLEGDASFINATTIDVSGEPVAAGALIVATGARPFIPTIPGLEAAGYLTSTTLLDIEELPASLVVIGGDM